MSDLPMPPLSKQQMQEAREAFNMFDKVRQDQHRPIPTTLGFCAGYYFVHIIYIISVKIYVTPIFCISFR